MKLCLIYEQGDYEGLEDADEFEPNELVLSCFHELCDEPAAHACPICHEELCDNCYRHHMEGPCGDRIQDFVDEFPTGPIEESEYSGLEDADEFETGYLGNCTQCGREITQEDDGVWKCGNQVCAGECGEVAHFSCAMPSRADLEIYETQPEGVMSSGWYFRRQNARGPFRSNWNILQGQRVLAAARAYDEYLCPNCAEQAGYIAESYEGLEDADEFDNYEIEWRSIYRGSIPNTSVRWILIVDANNQERFNIYISPVRGRAGEPVDDWREIDDFDLSFIQELATWLGVKWSHRTSYEKLTDGVLDALYMRSLEHKDRWNWPGEWGRLWEPPKGYPPNRPPNWYY